MAFPIVPAALGAGVIALILFTKEKQIPSSPVIEPPEPGPTPPTPIKPEPIPPGPTPIPTGGAGGYVTASTLNIRSAPNENSAIVATVVKGTTVAVPNPSTTFPATAAAPMGWFYVLTPGGAAGYAAAQYLDFGTAKERRMTPEEEQAYHEHRSEHPRPIYTSDNPEFPTEKISGVIGRGGRGGGGFRGGFHGRGFQGGFHRGFRHHGGGIVNFPWWGGWDYWPYYGYPYWPYPYWPYPYGYPYPQIAGKLRK